MPSMLNFGKHLVWTWDFQCLISSSIADSKSSRRPENPIPALYVLQYPDTKRVPHPCQSHCSMTQFKVARKIQPKRFVREAAIATSSATRAANNWVLLRHIARKPRPSSRRRPHVNMSENVRAGGMAGSTVRRLLLHQHARFAGCTPRD